MNEESEEEAGDAAAVGGDEPRQLPRRQPAAQLHPAHAYFAPYLGLQAPVLTHRRGEDWGHRDTFT